MSRIRALIIVTCLAAAFWPGEAKAQRRYQPPRPTFSPYHDLFRRDNGLLDPYNAQLAPRRRAAQEIGAMQQTIDEQESEIQGLNRQVQQFNQSLARPTGKSGTFMNYSHYFGGSNIGATGRRSRSRR